MQRWRGQAREYRQKQLLSLDKPKNHGRLHVPDIARGVPAEDRGDPQVLYSSSCQGEREGGGGGGYGFWGPQMGSP